MGGKLHLFNLCGDDFTFPSELPAEDEFVVVVEQAPLSLLFLHGLSFELQFRLIVLLSWHPWVEADDEQEQDEVDKVLGNLGTFEKLQDLELSWG